MRIFFVALVLIWTGSFAQAQSCPPEQLLQAQINQLSQELAEGVDTTPCELFYLFGEFARQKAPESGFDFLFDGVGRVICRSLAREQQETRRRLQELKRQHFWCYGY